MEITTFLFAFIFVFFLWFVGLFNIFTRDDSIRFLFSVISGIFYLILLVQSLNLTQDTYDTNLGIWVTNSMSANGFEFWVFGGLCFILGAISLLNVFILGVPLWNRLFRKGDIPKGFGGGGNFK